MKDNNVSVESFELPLLSEIEQSSALQMKDAYSDESGEQPGDKRYVPPPPAAGPPPDDGSLGPNARVYITKISTPAFPEEIEKILKKGSGRSPDTSIFDFYTLVLAISMHLGDPSSTRFINGTIELAFPRGTKILTYSPKARGVVTAIIEHGGESLTLSPGLDFFASATKGIPSDPTENRFVIPVGPGEKINGTFRRKIGHILTIPVSTLLDYQGLLKNEREMFWEIFPPLPGQDIESTGKEMQVVLSLMVQAPKNVPPKISARIEGRVKGNLWGVILLKGSAVL